MIAEPGEFLDNTCPYLEIAWRVLNMLAISNLTYSQLTAQQLHWLPVCDEAVPVIEAKPDVLWRSTSGTNSLLKWFFFLSISHFLYDFSCLRTVFCHCKSIFPAATVRVKQKLFRNSCFCFTEWHLFLYLLGKISTGILWMWYIANMNRSLFCCTYILQLKLEHWNINFFAFKTSHHHILFLEYTPINGCFFFVLFRQKLAGWRELASLQDGLSGNWPFSWWVLTVINIVSADTNTILNNQLNTDLFIPSMILPSWERERERGCRIM